MARWNSSVERSLHNLRCTALVALQVNNEMYAFLGSLLLSLYNIGPVLSTPVFVKRSISCALKSGRSDLVGAGSALTLNRLQWLQL